ncbi:MAG: hydrolase [Phycisphaerae bacterium]
MTTGALHVETFVDPSYGENAYVMSTSRSDGHTAGWIIDPGFHPQPSQILAYIADRGMQLEKIVLTHGHLDHIAGLDAVHSAHPKAAILLAAADYPMLEDAEANLSAFVGMPFVTQARADGDLAPGTVLQLGELSWQVFDTSGHSPGGRSLYCAAAGVVVTGDALFAGSIGRTDFPGADHQQLVANIRMRLLTLPDETVVYSGHGPATTIGNERKSNPFLAD